MVMMRLVRVFARQLQIAVMLCSDGFVVALCPRPLSGCGLIVMVGVNFLLRVSWERAYCKSTKREHQSGYS